MKRWFVARLRCIGLRRYGQPADPASCEPIAALYNAGMAARDDNSPSWRFAIDRGGSFTDVVATPDGKIVTDKLLSEHPEQNDDAASEAVAWLMARHGEAPNHVAAQHNATTAQNLLDQQADQERSAIDQRLQMAREELGRRAAQLSEAKATVANLDIDRIRRAISNIDVAQRQANEERVQLVARIASLESLVAREGPKGPPGVLAEAVEAEAAAEAQVARWTREADVLALLRDALRGAAEDTSRIFLGPVTRRAARYVNRMLPDCDLTFDETMGLAAIRRNGVDEPCVDLSRGTQEQLAALTRLAFADLLLDSGAPASLILDDPFVYSDDERLELMTDILLEASERMQVILLTCRAKAFRHVVGNRITLNQG